MNEFVQHSKRLNIKNWKHKKIEKFKNSLVLKDLIALVVIFFQVHLRNNQKEWIKKNEIDDCKVKILENQSEF